MHPRQLLLVCVATLFVAVEASTLLAGVAKINGTLPLGVPLAGYNHGERRVPLWPLPEMRNYTTFMMPSLGILEPTWVKALIVTNGVTSFCWVTLDGIGSDGTLNEFAYTYAVTMGFTIPYDNIVFSGSHSHSGPGAISPSMLWSMAPATDLLVPEIQQQLAMSMATAMVTAQLNLEPARIGIAVGNLVGVTTNRRAGISPYVTPTTIDPHLGVLRVDSATTGEPLAVLWNFAIHGVCYGPSNMYFSGDIMGVACELIEAAIGSGAVALFVNGDAGDIDPGPGMCDNAPTFVGSGRMAEAVVGVWSNITTVAEGVFMQAAAAVVEFGPTNLNFTLQRFANCTSGGPLDVCSICTFLRCDINTHMPASWIENTPRFVAFNFEIAGVQTVMVSIPGEALVELGWWIRNDTAAMKFDNTFLLGYSNSHMGYFATPNEYDIGGYESQLTFWGIGTAEMVRNGCKQVATMVSPGGAPSLNLL